MRTTAAKQRRILGCGLHACTKIWREQSGSVALARMFLRRPDIQKHSLWLQVRKAYPPLTELERLSSLLQAPLHASVLAWGYATEVEYLDQLTNCVSWFHTLVFDEQRLSRAPNRPLDEAEQQACREETRPVVRERLIEHLETMV